MLEFQDDWSPDDWFSDDWVSRGFNATEGEYRPTTMVEVDSLLLARMRRPWREDMSDRDLVESAVKLRLGHEALRLMQERNTHSEEAAIDLGVEAVHEARDKLRRAD